MNADISNFLTTTFLKNYFVGANSYTNLNGKDISVIVLDEATSYAMHNGVSYAVLHIDKFVLSGKETELVIFFNNQFCLLSGVVIKNIEFSFTTKHKIKLNISFLKLQILSKVDVKYRKADSLHIFNYLVSNDLPEKITIFDETYDFIDNRFFIGLLTKENTITDVELTITNKLIPVFLFEDKQIFIKQKPKNNNTDDIVYLCLNKKIDINYFFISLDKPYSKGIIKGKTKLNKLSETELRKMFINSILKEIQ